MPEIALITICAECRRQWPSDGDDRWRAYHGIEEHVDELAEVVFFCPECAEREFGGNHTCAKPSYNQAEGKKSGDA